MIACGLTHAMGRPSQGNMMPEELNLHVKSKMESAKSMLLRDMPADPSMGAAVRMQLARGDTRAVLTGGSSPTPEDRYREILSRAIKENSEGRFGKARELFFRLYELKGHYETRLSAANMTLKMGEAHAALVEYLTIAAHREELSERCVPYINSRLADPLPSRLLREHHRFLASRGLAGVRPHWTISWQRRGDGLQMSREPTSKSAC